tara:strand:- start:938 stop:1705 length:768 start_codon:yes stop_codon:yes gene_type:complete
MKFFKHTLIFSFSVIITSCIWLSPPEPTLLLTNEESEEELESKDGFVHDVIESKALKPIFQVESLPEGWTVDRHPVAKWGMSLPTVMSNVLDSAQSVEYWEEVLDLPTQYKLPLKRSKVLFQVITRLTIETVELHFINIDHIYSSTNHEPSHYIMNGVVRTVELKPTDFPQLMAEDIIKYKFLMEYGTPNEFNDGFHKYQNDVTTLKVKEIDKSHVQIQMNSVDVDNKLRQAIEDMYSEEGIEYQKKLLLRAIDF